MGRERDSVRPLGDYEAKESLRNEDTAKTRENVSGVERMQIHVILSDKFLYNRMS